MTFPNAGPCENALDSPHPAEEAVRQWKALCGLKGRRAQHEVNLANRANPNPVTTGAEWVLSYIARGAWYWYDASFD